MRFLCWLTLLCCARLTSAQDSTFILHNKVYNYAIPYTNGVMSEAFDAWEHLNFLQDERGGIVYVHRSPLMLSEDTHPESLTWALGGYQAQSEAFGIFVKSFPGLGERTDLIPFLLHNTLIDQSSQIRAYSLGDGTTAWLPEEFLLFEEYNTPEQTQYLLFNSFAIQVGEQVLCFWMILPKDTKWTDTQAVAQLPDLLNQIEINGIRLDFNRSEANGWQVNGSPGTTTKTLPLEVLNMQVEQALTKADKRPSVAFGTQTQYTDQGPHYHYNLPYDQLRLQAPGNVLQIFPRKEQHHNPVSYILTDNFRLKRTGSNVVNLGQQEEITILDTLEGFRLQLGSGDYTKPSELFSLSLRGRRWTAEDVNALYQAGIDTARFSDVLAEELLPDGQTRLYYGIDLEANFEPNWNLTPGFDLDPSVTLFLQRDEWLHIIKMERFFAFQLVDMLERIDYHGMQFDFEHEGVTLRLHEVLKTGKATAPEDLEMLQAFRADYPPAVRRSAVSDDPPVNYIRTDWSAEYLKQVKAGSTPSIDSSIDMSVAAIHLSDDAKTKTNVRTRGLRIQFLVQPSSPYCYGLAMDRSDLIMMDNLGTVLVGEGRLFPMDEYRSLNSEEEEDFSIPTPGWFGAYTKLADYGGFIAQAHSYVFPAPTAHTVHLQGTLYLKYYSDQLLTQEYPAKQAKSDFLAYSFQNTYELQNDRLAFYKENIYSDSGAPQFRFVNQNDVPILAIEFLDEDGNILSTHRPEDKFFFEQQDDETFFVPRMRITYCKPQLIPFTVDKQVSLGF
ncbi:MAG: hypothetical protein AAFO03_20450 [Bacteroidota bacterium]